MDIEKRPSTPRSGIEQNSVQKEPPRVPQTPKPKQK